MVVVVGHFTTTVVVLFQETESIPQKREHLCRKKNLQLNVNKMT